VCGNGYRRPKKSSSAVELIGYIRRVRRARVS
jgi:hypothetical protein